MIFQRPTKQVSSPSSFTTFMYLKTKMKMRKLSIPSSFISICWFSSLFAICLISFLYLHPRDTDNNCINIVKIIEPSKPILTTSTKYVSNETFALVNTTSDNSNIKGKSNDTASVIGLPTNDDVLPDDFLLNATSAGDVFTQTTTAIDNKTKETNDQAVIPKIEENIEDEEDFDTIPSYDVFVNPPWNCSKEERILWLKENLEKSKIIKSTLRTQHFEEKIQAFFNPTQGNQVTPPCWVKIFLTWTYPAHLFGKRELLSLESILRAHQHGGCVVILSKTMDSKPGREILKPILDRGFRVMSIAPDYHYLVNNTPGQAWLDRLESGETDPGTVPITINLSNLLRFVVLYKYGGVYFDNDMIILRPVSGLRNTIGIQSVDHRTGSWSTVSNGVLIFDQGHPLLWKFIEEFDSNFDGFKWGFNGPELATRVVSQALNNSMFEFHIIAPLGFYPVDWFQAKRLFEKNPKKGPSWALDKLAQIRAESYGVHLWNRQTRDSKIEKLSVIDRLFSHNCIICQDIHDS